MSLNDIIFNAPFNFFLNIKKLSVVSMPILLSAKMSAFLPFIPYMFEQAHVYLHALTISTISSLKSTLVPTGYAKEFIFWSSRDSNISLEPLISLTIFSFVKLVSIRWEMVWEPNEMLLSFISCIWDEERYLPSLFSDKITYQKYSCREIMLFEQRISIVIVITIPIIERNYY